MSLPEKLVGRDGRVIWDRQSNTLLPDPGTLVREIRSADGVTGDIWRHLIVMYEYTIS